MATASRSANVAELQRMFSNLDSNVIASVLAANNGQVDLTIDHLLTMSIDTENENHFQQSIPVTPLRQLPSIPNIYDDDPPPYPGHETSVHHRTSPMASLPRRSPNNSQTTSDSIVHREIQIQRWKTPYGQYRTFYIGDLPNDFLRLTISSNNEQKKSSTSQLVEDEHMALLLQNEEFVHELRHNKDFLTTLRTERSTPLLPLPTPSSSSTQRKNVSHHSTKPLPLPTPPTIETTKTPKVRAKMLQNVLTQIEQGQTMRTSMVPEESIIHHEGYSYGKDDREKVPLPPAPIVSEFDPMKLETNEEFISRLKHMGKNSMDKFNQLARKFTIKKPTKSSRQPMLFNSTQHEHLNNEFENDEDADLVNRNKSMFADSPWNTIK